MKTIVLIFRFLGLIFFGVAGFYFGDLLTGIINQNLNTLPYAIGGSVSWRRGFWYAYISVYPINWLLAIYPKYPAKLVSALAVGDRSGHRGLFFNPISYLPHHLAHPDFVAVLVFGTWVCNRHRPQETKDYFAITNKMPAFIRSIFHAKWQQEKSILIDTSVIIDGRIADIARTGFVPGNLVIPRFVLNELQYIADSAESLRRQRGRRGMEVLSELQKDRSINTTIADIDVEGVREVDEKLVMLARQMQAPILTNDYNLNRVAELQGVKVLNINELANAVKSILLPGEALLVKVIQEGKEQGQGVGYLDDGTMVVIEDGKEFIGRDIEVAVTKVLQTAAGRMIFSKPDGSVNNKGK